LPRVSFRRHIHSDHAGDAGTGPRLSVAAAAMNGDQNDDSADNGNGWWLRGGRTGGSPML